MWAKHVPKLNSIIQYKFITYTYNEYNTTVILSHIFTIYWRNTKFSTYFYEIMSNFLKINLFEFIQSNKVWDKGYMKWQTWIPVIFNIVNVIDFR